MAAIANLVTVEQYRLLPDDGGFCLELHHGEVVALPWPKVGHWRLRQRIMDLLRPKLAGFGEVGVVPPFRAIPEFDLRAADVAAISHARWATIDPEDNLTGAPELVIEVISPAKTEAKLRETVSLCLNNGALECWLVDRHKRSVTVVRKDGTTEVYEGDTEIPLAAFGADSLRLSDIFA